MKVLIGKYPKNSIRNRSSKVRIDKTDLWNLGDTLALIIHPALVKFQQVKHGSGLVENDDVPEIIRNPDDDIEFEDSMKIYQRFASNGWVLGGPLVLATGTGSR